MARLPSAPDLGTVAPVASRPVGSYDATPIAAGAEKIARAGVAAGESIARLGAGVASLGTAAGEVAQQQSHWELAKAQSDFTSRKIDLDAAIGKDQNYGPDAAGKDLPTRYTEQLNAIRAGSANLIQNPNMRGLFMDRTQPSFEQGRVAAQAHAHALGNDAQIAHVGEMGDKAINQAVAAKDDAARHDAIVAQSDLIDGLATTGAISDVQARTMKQTWAHQYATADLLHRADSDPLGVLNELRAKPGSADAVTNRILQNEGTGKNPNSSATGAGNFIDSTWLDVVKRNRPDLAQGRSDQDLLALRADKGLGREMTKAYQAENTAYLKKQGIEATPGNVYLAHFLGPGGAAAVLNANPNTPVQDALAKAVGPDKAKAMVAVNPTILQGQLTGSVKQWADGKMGGAATGEGSIYDMLRPDVREQIIQHAETKLAKNQQDDAAARQLEQFTVKGQITSDVSSMLNSGQGVDAMDAQRVRATFGDKGVAEWQSARNDAHSIWMGSHDLQTLNDQQIDQRLEQIAPKAGAENFARQQKVYDAVQSKVDDLRKQRTEDPAGSVQADPAVKQAAAGYDQNHPESFQPLAAARLAAQERAGIPEENRSPITKREAIDLTVPLRRMMPGQERETLSTMAGQFKERFGDGADQAFAYALRVHKVDAATSQVAARVMKKLGLGSLPDMADARATDHAAEIDAANKALGLDAFTQIGQEQTAAAFGAGWPKPEPGANVPLKAIKALRDAPELAADFDKKYGAGSSKKILEGYPVR